MRDLAMRKPRILLLQGPVGGFFSFLQNYLSEEGFEVHRLVFNGGDILFSLHSKYEIARFKDGGFDAYFLEIFNSWRPDAIVMFGDERPIHRSAKKCAKSARVQIWSFEEGYIRPNHVTFELDGNNANSSLRTTFDRSIAHEPPAAATPLSGQTLAMGLAAWAYFVAHRTTRWLFPGYIHHRERRLRDEFRFWMKSLYRRALARRYDEQLISQLLSGNYAPFFLVALQVHDDMQLRSHGRGWKNMTFADMVLASFSRCAPAEARLIIKAHPLDVGHGHHRKNIRLLIAKHDLADRVEYLQSGPLLPIVRHSKGLVTINSTAGIAALRNHVPVMAFGDALYHIPGLSHRPDGPADLDRFWSDPPRVDVDLAWRFEEHVFNYALIPGSFYLPRTWRSLSDQVAARLRAGLGLGLNINPPDEISNTGITPPPIESPPLTPRIGISWSGIWRERRTIETLLGGRTTFVMGPLGSCDLAVGWGHKPTARAIRRTANRAGIPYVAIEDGFLRSVRPGSADRPIGWITDRSGIYYDSRAPSDLETLLVKATSPSSETIAEGRSVIDRIRELRLSKYNHAPMLTTAELGLPFGRDVVVVVDQTFSDASVSGAGADSATFIRMMDAAVEDNPGQTIVVKTHPETVSGVKRGYLNDIARRRNVVLLTQNVNPWTLIEIARRVYVVSSQFGMEAMLAGVPVTCFGAAAYAGWGLTEDRITPIRRRRPGVTREAFAKAAYLDYCRWVDPYDGREIDFESAVDRLAFLRDRFHENTTTVCLGFSRWKRPAARAFLTGVGGAPTFCASENEALAEAVRKGGRVVVWGNRGFENRCERSSNVPIVRAEDGFLRSVGLGAAFVAPASLVFDAEGIYYDPRTRSDFERIAETIEFDEALLERAERLREMIVKRHISKYNDVGSKELSFPDGKRRILVPGQVEDDASVRLGSPIVISNLELLRRARGRWPDAHIIYKPHPDVQAGYRVGRIDEATARALADQIVIDVSMPSILAQVDHVETMTSLTGFEAILRGLTVTTHGQPFYAGWGLTEDLVPIRRRARQLTVDQLVAVALLAYPRYVDPVTGLPAPAEIVVERLSQQLNHSRRLHARLLAMGRSRYAWISHNILGALWRASRAQK